MKKFSNSHTALLAATCALGLLMGGNAFAADPMAKPATAAHDMSKHDSAQPGTDTWITTKVKTDLLATKDVSGMEIKVNTTNGVVSLAGTVATKAEFDKAVATAKGIQGVKKVDSSMLKVATK